jgi:hypothetical protein
MSYAQPVHLPVFQRSLQTARDGGFYIFGISTREEMKRGCEFLLKMGMKFI